MSTPATLANQYTAEYAENLLPYFMTFNDYFVWNIVSGGANAVVEDNIVNTFDGARSMLLTFTGSSDVVFNSGGTQTDTTITKDGNYILSYRFFKDDNDADCNFQVQVYVNGILLAYNVFTQNLYDSSGFVNENWNCYFQNLQLEAGDVVSFGFLANCDTIGTKLSVDGFKLEFVDKQQSFPSIYTQPLYRPIGWGYYADSLSTPTITIGTTYTQITIDKLGSATNKDFLPTDYLNSDLWITNKIAPQKIGDDYDGRFDVTITAKTGSPTAIEFIIEIGTGTVGTNKAFTGWIQAVGSAPYDQSLPLDFFALATFVTNGGKVYMRTDTGTVTIGRRNIKITRKSKGNGV